MPAQLKLLLSCHKGVELSLIFYTGSLAKYIYMADEVVITDASRKQQDTKRNPAFRRYFNYPVYFLALGAAAAATTCKSVASVLPFRHQSTGIITNV